jgi:hypothetical protein
MSQAQVLPPLGAGAGGAWELMISETADFGQRFFANSRGGVTGYVGIMLLAKNNFIDKAAKGWFKSSKIW